MTFRITHEICTHINATNCWYAKCKFQSTTHAIQKRISTVFGIQKKMTIWMRTQFLMFVTLLPNERKKTTPRPTDGSMCVCVCAILHGANTTFEHVNNLLLCCWKWPHDRNDRNSMRIVFVLAHVRHQIKCTF